MASYAHPTSFYPCPIRAAEIFKPQPTPPPIYYLKDHVRVVYGDSDWPTTSEDGEGMSEAQGKGITMVTGNARTKATMVAGQPLGLLSVRMREYCEKGDFSNSGFDHDVLKEEQFASPGRCFLLLFFREFYSFS
jgi:hypothetical protein